MSIKLTSTPCQY